MSTFSPIPEVYEGQGDKGTRPYVENERAEEPTPTISNLLRPGTAGAVGDILGIGCGTDP